MTETGRNKCLGKVINRPCSDEWLPETNMLLHQSVPVCFWRRLFLSVQRCYEMLPSVITVTAPTPPQGYRITTQGDNN